MLNRVVLVGRLTKDPTLSYTPSGVAVSNFTLAVNRAFTNQQGEREADFINCVVFRKPAENVSNYLKKGSLAGVDGRLQSRSYEGQNGRVYVTEVVCDSVQFLESGNREQKQEQQQPQSFSTPGAQQRQQGSFNVNMPSKGNSFADYGQPIDIDDDSLPF